MKKITVFILIFALNMESFCVWAQPQIAKKVKQVYINVRFQQHPGQWGLKVYPDAVSAIETNEMNNEGWMGPLYAAGTRKIRIGTNYLEIIPGGTWEVVAYTDSIGQMGFPSYFSELNDRQKQAWIESHGGLFCDVDFDNDCRPDLCMPIKIRSEGVHGLEDVDNDMNPYPIGSEIDNDKWTGEYEGFYYVPEKAVESVLGLPLRRVARIMDTDLSATGRIQIRYGIFEGWAGDGLYTGTIYYELRGN